MMNRTADWAFGANDVAFRQKFRKLRFQMIDDSQAIMALERIARGTTKGRGRAATWMASSATDAAKASAKPRKSSEEARRRKHILIEG